MSWKTIQATIVYLSTWHYDRLHSTRLCVRSAGTAFVVCLDVSKCYFADCVVMISRSIIYVQPFPSATRRQLMRSLAFRSVAGRPRRLPATFHGDVDFNYLATPVATATQWRRIRGSGEGQLIPDVRGGGQVNSISLTLLSTRPNNP